MDGPKPQKRPKRRKTKIPAERKITTPLRKEEKEKAAARLKEHEQTAAEERKKAGLSQLDLESVQDSMRIALLNAMQPRQIIAAIVQKYEINAERANQILEVVRKEAVRTTGFFRVQLQELCQRTIVDVLTDNDSTNAEKLKAVTLADDMFDLKVAPEEKAQTEAEAARAAIRRVRELTDDDLARLREQISTGEVDPKLLYQPSFPDVTIRRNKKKPGDQPK